MKTKLLHLYSDLLNLYGEYANLLALKKRLCDNGFEVEIISHKFGEEINLDGVSFLYCGAGTESKLLAAAKDILKYKDTIKEYADNGGAVLFTGNASELLGKEIKDLSGNVYCGLSVFDYTTEFINARFTGDVICETSILPQTVIGFINKSSNTSEITSCFVEIKKQFVNLFIPETDGGIYNSVIATHLLGPILIKNPPVTEYFVRLICDKFELSCNDSENENVLKAYETNISELLGGRNF